MNTVLTVIGWVFIGLLFLAIFVCAIVIPIFRKQSDFEDTDIYDSPKQMEVV